MKRGNKPKQSVLKLPRQHGKNPCKQNPLPLLLAPNPLPETWSNTSIRYPPWRRTVRLAHLSAMIPDTTFAAA